MVKPDIRLTASREGKVLLNVIRELTELQTDVANLKKVLELHGIVVQTCQGCQHVIEGTTSCIGHERTWLNAAGPLAVYIQFQGERRFFCADCLENLYFFRDWNDEDEHEHAMNTIAYWLVHYRHFSLTPRQETQGKRKSWQSLLEQTDMRYRMQFWVI